jgi:predicted O-methyltransferase YrrM
MEHFYHTLPGGFWFREAYDRILSELPRDRPSTVVEVGTCHGKSAAYLGVECIKRGIPAEIHCVDIFYWSPVPVHNLEAACRKNLEPLPNITIHAMWSIEAAKQFDDYSFDFVWLDAGHNYHAVRNDIRAWWPKVKKRGVIGGDDLPMPGVAKAVVESGRYEVGGGWREDETYKGPWEWWWRRKP